MERLEVFCELERRVDLSMLLAPSSDITGSSRHTSERSTSGGPSAISSAFVPGRIRLAAAWSRLLKSFCCSGDADTGDNWSSGMGGGLGSRGDTGEVMAVARKWRRRRDISCGCYLAKI